MMLIKKAKGQTLPFFFFICLTYNNKNKNMAFKIDYTEDKGKSWKEATVVKADGGIFGTVILTDDTTNEEKTVKAEQTKIMVRIS